jgi:hypothetical protein
LVVNTRTEADVKYRFAIQERNLLSVKVDLAFNLVLEKSMHKRTSATNALFLILLTVACCAMARTGSATSPVTFLDASGCYVPRDRDTLFFRDVPNGDSATETFEIRNIHPTGSIASTDVTTYTSGFRAGVSLFTLPAGLYADIECTYKPTARNETKIDSVTFSGNFAPKKIYLKGTSVNGPPRLPTTAFPDAQEGEAYSFQLSAADPDGDAAQYEMLAGPSWLGISVSGSCSGTPGYNEDGSTTDVTIQVYDPYSASTQTSIPITVQNTDRPPTLVIADTIYGVEETLIDAHPMVIDPDPGSYTAAVAYENYPSWMTVSGTHITGTFRDNATFDSLVVKGTTNGLTSSKLVYVSIADSAEEPVITSATQDSATEDLYFEYEASAYDPDGQSVAISFSNYPDWLQVSGSSIGGTPVEGRGDTSFVVNASDGGLVGSQEVALYVTALNDAPVISEKYPAADTLALPFDTSITFTCTYSDTDNQYDELSTWWEYDGQPATMPLRFRETGEHVVSFSVSDGTGGAASSTWVCSVAEPVVDESRSLELPIADDGSVCFTTASGFAVAIDFSSGQFLDQTVAVRELPGAATTSALGALLLLDIETTVTGGFTALLRATHADISDPYTFAFYDDPTGRWEIVGSSFSEINNTLSATVTHFSEWAVLRRDAVCSLRLRSAGSLPGSIAATAVQIAGGSGPVIRYSIPLLLEGRHVRIQVCDLRGKNLFNPFSGRAAGGWHSTRLSEELSTGMYLWVLTIGDLQVARRFQISR